MGANVSRHGIALASKVCATQCSSTVNLIKFSEENIYAITNDLDHIKLIMNIVHPHENCITESHDCTCLE